MDAWSALYRGVGRLWKRNDVDGRDTGAADKFDSHHNIGSADELDHRRDVRSAAHSGSSGDPG